MGQSEIMLIAIFLMGGVFMLVIAAVLFSFLSLWIQAIASGAPVSLPMLVFMKMRKVPPRIIVYANINAVKAGLKIGVHALEAHYLAGGDVPRTVAASIAASKAGIPLTFGQASAIDLAGRDALEFVKESSYEKRIQCWCGGRFEPNWTEWNRLDHFSPRWHDCRRWPKLRSGIRWRLHRGRPSG